MSAVYADNILCVAEELYEIAHRARASKTHNIVDMTDLLKRKLGVELSKPAQLHQQENLQEAAPSRSVMCERIFSDRVISAPVTESPTPHYPGLNVRWVRINGSFRLQQGWWIDHDDARTWIWNDVPCYMPTT